MSSENRRVRVQVVDSLMYGLISKALEKTQWTEGTRPDVKTVRQRLRVCERVAQIAVDMKFGHLQPTAENSITIGDDEYHELLLWAFGTLFRDVWSEVRAWPGCAGPEEFPAGEVIGEVSCCSDDEELP